jgi:hypothetical protein
MLQAGSSKLLLLSGLLGVAVFVFAGTQHSSNVSTKAGHEHTTKSEPSYNGYASEKRIAAPLLPSSSISLSGHSVKTASTTFRLSKSDTDYSELQNQKSPNLNDYDNRNGRQSLNSPTNNIHLPTEERQPDLVDRTRDFFKQRINQAMQQTSINRNRIGATKNGANAFSRETSPREKFELAKSNNTDSTLQDPDNSGDTADESGDEYDDYESDDEYQDTPTPPPPRNYFAPANNLSPFNSPFSSSTVNPELGENSVGALGGFFDLPGKHKKHSAEGNSAGNQTGSLPQMRNGAKSTYSTGSVIRRYQKPNETLLSESNHELSTILELPTTTDFSETNLGLNPNDLKIVWKSQSSPFRSNLEVIYRRILLNPSINYDSLHAKALIIADIRLADHFNSENNYSKANYYREDALRRERLNNIDNSNSAPQ